MAALVNSARGVTLVGGGEVDANDLILALSLAPSLVAADGGANRLAELGHTPEAIIGDMDSLAAPLRARWLDRMHHIPEQDSTDFDKCLRSIDASLTLALGFTGARLDHTLSAMTALVRHGRSNVIVLSGQDICFLAPPRLDLPITVGARVSLFPLGPVQGRSQGLYWPIDGIDFTPSAIIGTSNRASADRITLDLIAPCMLVLLERDMLVPVSDLLRSARGWSQTEA